MNQGSGQQRKSTDGCRHRAAWCLGLIGLLLVMGWPGVPLADPESERLAALGINLFRATLAADRGIEAKGDAEGLLLLMVFKDDPLLAEELKERLLRPGPIRKQPIRAHIVTVADLPRYSAPPLAGIFLTQRLPGNVLRELVAFSTARGIILFSPFRGQVEQGASAGQYVSAWVQPYVNLRTLAESGIELKEFFLNIARTYP